MIDANELDRRFDDGEDVLEHFDLSQAVRPNLDTQPRRVNVDFPAWVVGALDRQAARLGITRQVLIKVWIAERIDAEDAARARRAPPPADPAAVSPAA